MCTLGKVQQSEHAVDEHTYGIGCPVHLLKYNWYHGKMSQEDANRLLSVVDGPHFLVRESRREAGMLILSVKDEKGITHFPIDRGPGWYSLTNSSNEFDTVGELVAYYKNKSRSENPTLCLGSPCVDVQEKMEAASGNLTGYVNRGLNVCLTQKVSVYCIC